MTATSGARRDILDAVESALGRSKRDAYAISQEACSLLADMEAVRPGLSTPDPVVSFTNRVVGPKVGATVERISTIADLPVAIARRLAASGREPQVTLQPTGMLTGLDWASSGLRLGNTIDDGVVVGLALWGIAETGSLVFHSAADMPILHNFLGAVHFVAVHAGGIVPHLDDYASAARISGDPAPRNACLITGASGTTDIEGSLVKGAHGPRELHVVIIDQLP